MKLKDKVIIVTGAAGVLGTGAVQRFVAEGAKVACVDMNEEKLEELKGRLGEGAEHVMTYAANVADFEEVKATVAKVKENYGKIDMLLNLAGNPSGDGHGDVPYGQKDFKVINYVVQVNLMGAMAFTHEVLPGMMEQGSGKIISISSIDGIRGTDNLGKADYCAAKSGLYGFTKAIAKETAHAGIRANTISLGQFANFKEKDNARPETWEKYGAGSILNRFGEPSELASLAVFLFSDEADYITGQNYILGGGCYM